MTGLYHHFERIWSCFVWRVHFNNGPDSFKSSVIESQNQKDFQINFSCIHFDYTIYNWTRWIQLIYWFHIKIRRMCWTEHEKTNALVFRLFFLWLVSKQCTKMANQLIIFNNEVSPNEMKLITNSKCELIHLFGATFVCQRKTSHRSDGNVGAHNYCSFKFYYFWLLTSCKIV